MKSVKKIVETTDLTVKFKDFLVLDHINVSIEQSAGVIGLIGPNGAGKTTLLNTFIGQIGLFEGTVVAETAHIAYCPDTPEFDPYLSAFEIMQQSLRLAGKDGNAAKITQTLEQVGLFEHRYRIAGNFSRGMKQRLGIAAALVLEPQLLLLDEPTSALDPFGRADILKIITEVSRRLTVIISSHILSDIQKIATSLIVLNKGQLIYEGPAADFITVNDHMATLALRDIEAGEATLNYLSHKGAEVQWDGQNQQVIFPDDQLSKILQLMIPMATQIRYLGRHEMTLERSFEDAVLQREGKE
ncbi:ABC transporter ATP-binding protein [Lactiplantibacillus pentosus]|nr:ABC transporter ATP-binding protein [Lactiplantibacillus pentosus]